MPIKALYDELVRKIKEAGINSSFQNSSIRLSDSARPPLLPVFPDLPLNADLALPLLHPARRGAGRLGGRRGQHRSRPGADPAMVLRPKCSVRFR